MSVGGPFRGLGSPPEGDFYTEEDLVAHARDTMAVLDEVRPFVKIGHNSAQELARRSGFYAEDDTPQTGRWSNFRVKGGKLIADATAVPAKLADVIESGAFSRLSVERKPYESQRGKGVFRNVIRAVAFLGAKAPGIKTLDDVVALYGDDEADDDEMTTVDRELTQTATLDLNLELSSPVREMEESSDTRGEMPDTTAALELSEEQLASLAEAMGIEDDEVTVDAIVARASELRQHAESEETEEEETEETEEEEEPRRSARQHSDPGGVYLSDAEYYGLVDRANAGVRAEARLLEQERDALLTAAMSEGRIDPAQLPEFQRLYEEQPDFVARMIETLPVNEERARIYGSDEDSEPSEEDEALYRQFAEFVGEESIEISENRR
jgi:hypothetical protein